MQSSKLFWEGMPISETSDKGAVHCSQSIVCMLILEVGFYATASWQAKRERMLKKFRIISAFVKTLAKVKLGVI